jgi:hypothetical protein
MDRGNEEDHQVNAGGNKMRRVLVCGGRDYTNKELLYRKLDEAHEFSSIVCIISGMAPGADTLAAEWAKERGIELAPFPADWSKYSRAAGPIRNAKMLVEGKPDVVMAFPGDKGTKDMIKRATKAKIPVVQIHI